MISVGLTYVFSAIYLSFIVSMVISINENDTVRRIARETLRRAGKLLGVLAIAAIIVQVLTFFSNS